MAILEQHQLKEILPQAYPFLLIDRVVELEKDKRLVAIKNITANEWTYQSHPPKGRDLANSPQEIGGQGHKGQNSFPQTLLIEAAAQAALVLYQVSKVQPGQPQPRFVMGRVKAEFHQPVSVGEQLRLEVEAGKFMKDASYADVLIEADSKSVAEITVFLGILRN